MKIEALSAGQVLYDVSRQGVGNTMLKSTCIYEVKVTAIAEDRKMFHASWNGNPIRTYYSVPKSWKKKRPVLVVGRLTSRLANRDEIKRGKLEERSTYFALILPTSGKTEVQP